MSEDHSPTFIDPPATFRERARVRSRADYEARHRESLADPESFWRRELAGLLGDWQHVKVGELPHPRWFVGARLNVSERCLGIDPGPPPADGMLVRARMDEGATCAADAEAVYVLIHAEERLGWWHFAAGTAYWLPLLLLILGWILTYI